MSQFTEADKLHWETKKLEAEAREMMRSPMSKPGFWFGAIPAVVAIIGVGLQYYASSIDYKKAEVLREQAEFKTLLAQKRLEDLDKEVVEKKHALDELTKNMNELEAIRRSKDQEVQNLIQLIDELKNTKVDMRTQFQKLDTSLQSLRNQQAQSNSLAKQQREIVGNLGTPKK